ncbi:hypothetical protein IFR04_006351 [Cadophora malorum]|uniref:Fe2OG dioxygenase domain-containing protein n=1 Tax=Cadophora malorum TaxID=108018 RepID=A0A8H7TKD4_9HELO|nr:hypothetical protein IFR04_006351 [Cadophora malorum]
MTTTSVTTSGSEEYTLLRLSSANGPVYRKIKIAPLRDARPDEIPLIDISGIYSTSLDDRKAVAAQIHNAATNNGFFYVKDHGIDDSVIRAAYESSLEFFRQPDEVKQKVNAELSPCLNGWKPPKTQRINEAESIDVRETFSFRYNPTYDPAVVGNLELIPAETRESLVTNEFCWENTTNLPNLKKDIINYWRSTLGLARQLTRSFALALSLPETDLDSKITYPDAGVGLNYYPSIPPSSSDSEEQVSIGSHTDFQLFTILWQDSNGGLQVLNREGEWINAAPIEGTFVVNIGDYLQRITNDRYISTVHRARNLSGKERISMPMFFGFNLNETCGVLDSCVDEEHPRKYEPISCKEWVELRVKAMHTTE